ncbi:MAG: hypothetical protein JO112_08845, partial [Planctomycetes bacterium]|nr:hypothetical protein [Planctomycetota bacterium]
MRKVFFCILLVVFGVMSVVGGFKERGVAEASSKEPEEISLKDLIARGPEGNPNIILKDFVLRKNYVYQTRNGSWDGAWVPVAPRSAAGPNQAGGDAARMEA